MVGGLGLVYRGVGMIKNQFVHKNGSYNTYTFIDAYIYIVK